MKSQRLGLNKKEVDHHGRSVRRLRREPDDFTCLELSNMVMEGRRLGVHKIEDNHYERFTRRLKRKPDEFTGLELRKVVLKGPQLGFHKVEDNDYDDDEDDMDPQYNMFLKKLMVDGKSYALEVAQSNGVPVYLKYHVEDKSDDEDREPLTRRKMSNPKKGEKIQARKENKHKMGSPKNLRSVQGREKRDFEEHDAGDLRMDECYLSFLSGIIKEDKYWVFVCASGMRVVYEDDKDGGSSDSEIEVWDDAPHGSEWNRTPFVSGRGYRPSEFSQFRKKVMGILRRPYNQEEYEILLRDIKEQKTVGRIKDLRSRPISFSVGGSTKSYLDHHLDVGREIYAVRHDQRKVLNILRGFFFWLENVNLPMSILIASAYSQRRRRSIQTMVRCLVSGSSTRASIGDSNGVQVAAAAAAELKDGGFVSLFAGNSYNEHVPFWS